jgi:hypothetical protein
LLFSKMLGVVEQHFEWKYPSNSLSPLMNK